MTSSPDRQEKWITAKIIKLRAGLISTLDESTFTLCLAERLRATASRSSGTPGTGA